MSVTKDDLLKLSVPELEALSSLVEEAKKEVQKKAAQAAKDKIRAFAAEAGLSVEELFGLGGSAAKASTKKEVAPKYAHPENATITWSGRGRQPGWFKDYVTQHGEAKAEADLLIK